jgi:hypothetical protein
MNRQIIKSVFFRLPLWAAVVALSGAMALAQGAAPDAAGSAAPAAAARTDGQIEMDVVHGLDASQALKSDLITAATIQSEVTLSGTVSSEASRELAESIASHVAGVSKVNNHLTVGDPQAAANASDMQASNQSDNAGSPDNAEQTAPAPDEGPLPIPSQVQPPPPARPQYATAPPQNAPAPPPVYEAPKGPVTIAQGTLLQLRTNEPVASKKAKNGQPVEFTVIRDVAVGGVLAIPRGVTVHGVVTEVKQAGQVSGSPVLALKLTSLDLGGQNYPLDSDQFKVKGPGKGGETAGRAVTGALFGAIIGGAVGRGEGAAIGAGAGAAVGTASSAASYGPGVWIPAEARVDFHLNTPLTVTPVSAQEAARLAQGLYPGGPNLYRRDTYGRPYAVAYPPVYYRPYYAMGGYYYWR